MKVLLISKFARTGGAGIACKRLFSALKNTNIPVNLLSHEYGEKDQKKLINRIVELFNKVWVLLLFILERLSFVLYEKSRLERFMFSMANIGANLIRRKLVHSTDIIHFHWINSRMLSLSGIRKFLRLNKPVVWTFHDMWAFTGGCHYALD